MIRKIQQKVGPADLDNLNLLELDLLNKCLSFNTFYNGELKKLLVIPGILLMILIII